VSVRCLNADTNGVLMQQARHVTSVQAHPILDEAPEPATSLQQTRVPDGDLQRSAPSSPALQHHDNPGVAAIHTLSSMQQEAQQPAPSSNADRPGLASATAAKDLPAVAAMSQPPEQYAEKHALPCQAESLMDSVHSQAKHMLSQHLMLQSYPDWQQVHAELQQLAASSKFRLHPFAQEHCPPLQQVAALHASSSAGDIGGLERNAAARDGQGDFLQCDVGSADRAGPSDVQRLGTAAETKPASSSYPGISCDNRSAATHMHAACSLNMNPLVTCKSSYSMSSCCSQASS